MFRFVITSLFMAGSFSFADSSTDEALKKTQDLLRNPNERNQAITTPAALQSVQQLKNISGGDVKIEEDMWGLASELMPLLNEVSGGDPEKMKQFMEQAQTNPKGFAERFPAAQREKLRQIAEKIAQKQTKKP